jgi:prevent-host-death family protein
MVGRTAAADTCVKQAGWTDIRRRQKMQWSLQDAKTRFSEVVERALAEGVQRVTRHGKDEVVIVSSGQWAEMQGKEQSLVAFLLESSLKNAELDIVRDTSGMRAVE